MPARKTAIAVSEDLLRAVDDAAGQRGESRSRFINHVLRAAVRARRDAEITRRLNEIFAGPAPTKKRRKPTEPLDETGTDWGDERW